MYIHNVVSNVIFIMYIHIVDSYCTADLSRSMYYKYMYMKVTDYVLDDDHGPWISYAYGLCPIFTDVSS